MPAIKKVLSLDEVEAQMMFELPTRELMHHTHSGKHVTNTTTKTVTATQCAAAASTNSTQAAVANPTAIGLAAALSAAFNINVAPALAAQAAQNCNLLINNP